MNTAPWNKFDCSTGARGKGSAAPPQPPDITAGRVNLKRYHTHVGGEYNRARFELLKTGEITMVMDWNQYHKEIGGRVGELGKLSPDTLRGYQTLSAANSKTTKLGEKTRQLISLAVAVTTRCDGCIVFHTDAALKAGATREEISEALGVAVSMNAGAALIYSARVLDAVEAKSAAVHGA
jgi:AhpD family alkylhydroperoxidase